MSGANKPVVYERFHLALWLPPVLGFRLRAFMRQASELKFLLGEIEIFR